MLRSSLVALVVSVACAGLACVPSGKAPPWDAGAPKKTIEIAAFEPSANVMTEPFADDFSRDGAALGDDWLVLDTRAWKIENGMLCAQNAHNKGAWLARTLPPNARIAFTAMSTSPDGDLKAELWGDGVTGASGVSYVDATSYLVIFGGWKNRIHAFARLNEHGADRLEVPVVQAADDPRAKPVQPNRPYRFVVERTDGRTVKVAIDGQPFFEFPDTAPLRGRGHDHFGFNDWEVKVCFDDVSVTPLP
jgi:Farnesoic acid 0-methyl transferase